MSHQAWWGRAELIPKWMERLPNWDLEMANPFGGRALHYAASSGCVATVDAVLRAGGNARTRCATNPYG